MTDDAVNETDQTYGADEADETDETDDGPDRRAPIWMILALLGTAVVCCPVISCATLPALHAVSGLLHPSATPAHRPSSSSAPGSATPTPSSGR
jgi:hypothetical protein